MDVVIYFLCVHEYIYVNIYIYIYTKTYCIRVSHKYALNCVYIFSHIQKCNVKLCRKASINRVCPSVSLGLSVALRALCCVQVDHLELRQVTAAAARLLANHHLEHNDRRSGDGAEFNRRPVNTSHNTGNPAPQHAVFEEGCEALRK